MLYYILYFYTKFIIKNYYFIQQNLFEDKMALGITGSALATPSQTKKIAYSPINKSKQLISPINKSKQLISPINKSKQQTSPINKLTNLEKSPIKEISFSNNNNNERQKDSITESYITPVHNKVNKTEYKRPEMCVNEIEYARGIFHWILESTPPTKPENNYNISKFLQYCINTIYLKKIISYIQINSQQILLQMIVMILYQITQYQNGHKIVQL